MEGVTDAPMRAFLSERGGFTHCVSEFLRISQDAPPARVFQRHVPELLRTTCTTPSGLPVQIQLLGGNPERMAESARVALTAGAKAIDLNFGCPAPTVNRHDGGATLLKYPDRIYGIVKAVRDALPPEVPVSAKLRLGWDTVDSIHLNAERAAEGGASWITIHARTRMQGYQPPVYWKPIGEVRRRLGIPVIANGDIWTIEDFERCREMTGCEHFMLGRGALADPSLAMRITGTASDFKPQVAAHWTPLLLRFAEISAETHSEATQVNSYIPRRIKQWLRMADQRIRLPWIDSVKRSSNLEEIWSALARA